MLCALLLLWQVRGDDPWSIRCSRLAALFTTIGCAIWGVIEFYDERDQSPSRNFYGVLRVQEIGDDDGRPSPPAHPRHDPARQAVPGRRSLAHAADELLHGHLRHRPRCSTCCIRAWTRSSVGVIGLGTGTLAVYGTPTATPTASTTSIPASSQSRSATSRYLHDSGRHDRDRARRRAPGARARAAAELRRARDRRVLVSDAIPGAPDHLEARRVYLKHMKPDGVIAFHVTNRFLDLVPVVEGTRARARPAHAVDRRRRRRLPLASRSDWVLLTDPAATARAPAAHRGRDERSAPRPRLAGVDRRFQQSGAGAEIADASDA